VANLEGIWGDGSKRLIDPPEVQLRNAIIDAGLEAPTEVILDGKIHRFKSGSKGRGGHGDKSGWYVAFGDNGIPAGKFGDWRFGVEYTWVANIGRDLSPHEKMAFTRKMEEARQAREESEKLMRDNVSEVVERIWADSAEANSDHPYLVKKQIKPNGARVTGDGRLIVPLFNDDGEMTTLQYITGDTGSKLYHTGGKTGGSFWRIGSNEESHIYIAEGYATAATIYETTGVACYVAYSASNIPSVAGQLRERHGGSKRIIVVADNDSSGVGKSYADQASAKFGAQVVLPPLDGMDANDYLLAGHDLSALLEPKEVKMDWLVDANEFRDQPSAMSWDIKNWLTRGLVMVHGPSGSGKTFLVLDWCLRMAATEMENRDWCGNRTKHAPVVYLAGEGHYGLRARVAAWMQHHEVEHIDFWMSKTGTDLNTTEGLVKIIDNVRALPEHQRPKVIVVDTLHRFLRGDENSAQDAKTMLDSCAILMEEFDCTVILVHHTGVSEEAQHRARGSSAWRGALDIEISVKPGKNGPIEVIQRKMKDAEMQESLFFDLKKVDIRGWHDEDGDKVSSVVLDQTNQPVKMEKKVSRVEENRRRFERAWHHCNRDRDDQKRPFLSRSALLNYQVNELGATESYAKKQLQPSATSLIGVLLDADYIEIYGSGWSAKSTSLIIDFGDSNEG
jgi:putative DNA primase/helicase